MEDNNNNKSTQMQQEELLKIRLDNLEANMVYIEGGTFVMGAAVYDCDTESNEEPAHQVTLSSFSIGRYQVTQEEWATVMGNNPTDSYVADCPVEGVSWEDCQIFISRLNALTGKSYRLPSEAEWEYAARGGKKSQGYKFSGSNDIFDVAWYEWHDLVLGDYKAHPVGQKSPNELGQYDMSGNVEEWCNDWYGEYNPSSQINPKGATSGSYRVCRGGCCYSFDCDCRVSFRDYDVPNSRSGMRGFRLAL